MSTNICPCRLTQEKLENAGWFDKTTGYCTAIYEDENGVIKTGCGKLYSKHPSAQITATQGNLLII